MRQVIIIAAIGAAVLLTGCGTAKGVASQNAPSPGTTGPTTPATGPATPAHPHDCGSAITHALGPSTQVFTSSAGALTCFSAAATACEPASIDVTVMGVDAGSHNAFTIDPGGAPGSCAVTVTSQFYMVPVRPTQSPAQVTHGKVTGVAGTGVMLSLAGQAVLIPSAVTTSPSGLPPF
jgi:hypothetical protein